MDSGGHSAALEAQITAQRFEFKYAICEMQAMAIQDYVASYMSPDQHAGRQNDYPVTSLYFDGPQMPTYRSSVHGERNRYKIRARAYDVDDLDSVYLEIKWRNHQVLRKTRVRLLDEEALEYFAHSVTPAGMLSRMAARERIDFLAIRDRMERQLATPRALVRYRREAWVSTDGAPVRITFDRELECRPCLAYGSGIWSPKESWYRVSTYNIALEVKFTETFPKWLDQVIKRFNLRALSICKYVHCVRELGRNGVRVGGTSHSLMSA